MQNGPVGSCSLPAWDQQSGSGKDIEYAAESKYMGLIEKPISLGYLVASLWQ